MRKLLLLLPLLLLLFIPSVHSPIVHTQVLPHNPSPAPSPTPNPLSLKILSVSVIGCSQSANVNASWTGPSYYTIDPSSFYLVIITPNAVYSNSSNVLHPTNTVSTWYLIQNIPITLHISFISCNAISQEKLVFSDGSYFQVF